MSIPWVMNAWFKRIIIAVVVFEIAYLALGNLVLWLPVTQTLVNAIRPEKFEVTWQQAWTFYPFRVHVRGLSANGQSRRQQWQLEMTRGAASVSLLPLMRRHVSLHDVMGENVLYFQRPRLKPENDYADTRAFFPPIRHRVLNTAEPIPSGKRPWTVRVANARVRGKHAVWLYHMKAVMQGELEADFRYQTRGGPFSLRDGKIDIVINDLDISGNRDALKDIVLKGTAGFAEFVPRDNKGIDALAFLTLDVELSGAVHSLAFLNHYLRSLEGMRLEGGGMAAGRLNFSEGTLRAGTKLDVIAPALSLELLDHRASGSGTVRLTVDPEAPERLSVLVEFAELVGKRLGDNRPLIVGRGLVVDAHGGPKVFPGGGELPRASRLAVSIPSVSVPDLAAFQQYVPDHTGLRLWGGEGVLRGRGEIDATRLNVDLHLDAEAADIGIKDYRFQSNIAVALLAETHAADPDSIDVSGSSVRLFDTRLASKDNDASDASQAYLVVDQGLLRFPRRNQTAGEQSLLRVRESGVAQLLEQVDGGLELSGHVSELGWLNQLIKNQYRVKITGAGDLQARLGLRGGWLAAGSEVKLRSDGLATEVLEYVATGQGVVVLRMGEGGRRPDAHIGVRLWDASFKRKDEDRSFIDRVDLRLQAVARGLSYEGPTEDLTLRLYMPVARITDMSVYNTYLPDNFPLRLLNGEADLVADIELEPSAASGFVSLKTRGLRSRLDQQELSGDLTVNINLAGGEPREMNFDISGSTLILDNVKVDGPTETSGQSDWNARIEFTHADTVWRRPIRIQAQADFEMKDSTPVVAVMSNYWKKNGWIQKLLTVGRIVGEAHMDMQQNRVIFPYAFAGSEEMDIGAKGVIDGQTREGVIFARYRKLKGLLKILDSKRSFDVIRPQKKFDAYSPEAVAR